jgi:hypothetical protein
MRRPRHTRPQLPRRRSSRRSPSALAVLTALVCVLVHAVLPIIHRPHAPMVDPLRGIAAAAGNGLAQASPEPLATPDPAHDCAACPACRMIGGGPGFLPSFAAASVSPQTCRIAAWSVPQRTVIPTMAASVAPRGPPVWC